MSKRSHSDMESGALLEDDDANGACSGGQPSGAAPRGDELTPEERRVQRRYLMFVEYRGDEFRGSQRQREGVKTVQDSLEQAFQAVVKEFTTVYLSSRTDAGVHAIANSAHVHIIRRKRNSREPAAEPFAPDTLRSAVNYWLRCNQQSVRVTHMQLVAPRFNARHNAVGRTYVYRIVCPSSPQTVSIFQYQRVWTYDGSLNAAAMRSAAGHLLGRHDFSSFRAAGCQAKSPVRTLESLDIEEAAAAPAWAPPSAVATLTSPASRTLVLRVRARSFLYHQVRLMVAWLVEVGAGRREAGETAEVLGRRNVGALRCKMAPSWGLYLAQVHYDAASLVTTGHYGGSDASGATEAGAAAAGPGAADDATAGRATAVAPARP